MDRRLERQIWVRAHARCEYCHFPHEFAEYPFHIDHIIAEKHGGKTEAENLALSCFYCNTSKGPNIAGIDSLTGELTPLYHPRKQDWNEHFRWNGSRLVGLTAIGRVTVHVLNINDAAALNVRRVLMSESRYPL